MSKTIYGNVPKIVRRRTYYLMKKYGMSLADAFDDSVRTGGYDKSKYADLVNAWYFSDYRAFIPKAYLREYLDFSKYPLAYGRAEK